MRDAVSAGSGPVAPCKAKADQPTCAQLAHASDMAMLSEHAYDPSAPVPPGYTYLDPTTEAGKKQLAQIGIQPSALSPPNSDFRAQVFATGSADAPHYVVAFRGSVTGEDWENNLEQGSGFVSSSYYKRAMQIAQRVNQFTNGNVEFTGHSLVGGLASAAAASTDLPATTFNAAGLNPVTVEGSLNASFAQATSKITAYHVAGEVLNAIQSHPITALGSVPGVGPLLAAIRLIRGNKLLPPAAGHHYVLPADPPPGTTGFAKYNPLDRHKMPWVQNGIRAKQQELGCS